MNADEIRGAAYHDLKVGLMAASEEGYQEMERFLAPLWLDDAYAGRSAAHRSPAGRHSAQPVRFRPLRRTAFHCPRNGYLFNPADTGVHRESDHRRPSRLELAIGRNFPLFRRAAADRIIHRISRENALFALVTALPNVIPSVIDLPVGGR